MEEAEPSPVKQPPAGMVLVPDGSFHMGCAPSDSTCHDDEAPRHKVVISAFYIDATEVTVAAYRSCTSAGHCSPPGTFEQCNWDQSSRTNHPINCVSWHQADSYCRWAGKRLPTEAEWEKAARGTDDRIYPWGNQPPTCQLAIMDEDGDGCGRESTWPVGTREAGKSPYGALDMTGNVWEWVNDRYRDDAYATHGSHDPTGPAEGTARV